MVNEHRPCVFNPYMNSNRKIKISNSKAFTLKLKYQNMTMTYPVSLYEKNNYGVLKSNFQVISV